MTSINQAGLDLIKEFEGCKLTTYRDTANVLTIGYGHTGPDVYQGQTISQDEADTLLKLDLHEAESQVESALRVPVSPNQFAALVSFQFNTGHLVGSTLLRRLNSGFPVAAAEHFEDWSKDHEGGKLVVSKGLLRRRTAERALFLAPDTERSIAPRASS